MIPGRTLEPQAAAIDRPQADIGQEIERYGMPWVDQFAGHILLTAQALQRLHVAFDGKFVR